MLKRRLAVHFFQVEDYKKAKPLSFGDMLADAFDSRNMVEIYQHNEKKPIGYFIEAIYCDAVSGKFLYTKESFDGKEKPGEICFISMGSHYYAPE